MKIASQKANVKSITLSKYILLTCMTLKIPINDFFKVSRLAYFIQAWSYTLYQNSITEELPEAAVVGPIYRSIQNFYKKIGGANMMLIFKQLEGITDENINDQEFILNLASSYEESLGLYKTNDQHVKIIELISEVINKYGNKEDIELNILCHNEQPYLKARGDILPFTNSRNKITLKSMSNYYNSLLLDN